MSDTPYARAKCSAKVDGRTLNPIAKITRALVIATVFCFGVALAQPSNPQAPRPAESGRAPQGETGQSAQSTPPSPKPVIRPNSASDRPPAMTSPAPAQPKTEGEHAAGHDYTSSEWWLVYLTGALVAVTSGLAIYTALLWRATVSLGRDAKSTSDRQAAQMNESLAVSRESSAAAMKSAKTAELALVNLERPYVFIDFGSTGFIDGAVRTGSGRIHVTFRTTYYMVPFSFRNYGKTAGVLKELYARFVATPKGELPLHIDRRSVTGDLLASGWTVLGADPAIFRRDLADDVGLDRMAAILEGKQDLHLIGFIRYQDLFGRMHVTGFCGTWDEYTNRHVLRGDERYCYFADEPHVS